MKDEVLSAPEQVYAVLGTVAADGGAGDAHPPPVPPAAVLQL